MNTWTVIGTRFPALGGCHRDLGGCHRDLGGCHRDLGGCHRDLGGCLLLLSVDEFGSKLSHNFDTSHYSPADV